MRPSIAVIAILLIGLTVSACKRSEAPPEPAAQSPAETFPTEVVEQPEVATVPDEPPPAPAQQEQGTTPR
jgi:hypothetical protein